MFGGPYFGQNYFGQGPPGIPSLPPLPPPNRMIFAGIEISPTVTATIQIEPSVMADVFLLEPN